MHTVSEMALPRITRLYVTQVINFHGCEMLIFRLKFVIFSSHFFLLMLIT